MNYSVSAFGFDIRPKSAALRCLIAVLVYAPFIAAVGARLPRKAGLPVLPLFEGLWAKSWSLRIYAARLTVSVGTGLILACLSLFYDDLMTTWLGSARSAASAFAPTAAFLIFAVICEEILYRSCIFAAFAIAVQFILGFRCNRLCDSTWSAVLIANVLQAVIFGASHIATGGGILTTEPWYIRLPLIWQTWGGLVFGFIFSAYGIESAIVCHATTDLFLLAVSRGELRW